MQTVPLPTAETPWTRTCEKLAEQGRLVRSTAVKTGFVLAITVWPRSLRSARKLRQPKSSARSSTRPAGRLRESKYRGGGCQRAIGWAGGLGLERGIRVERLTRGHL